MKYRGFVARLTSHEGRQSTGKKFVSYSVKLENENGSEQEGWISFGFEEPPFKEGDFIEFEAEKNGKGYNNYVKGTGKIIKNPPARAGAKKSTEPVSATAAGNGREASGSGGSGGAIVGSVANDRQTSIVLQHSQEMALRAVAILLEHDALPMSTAKTSAGTAKRFAEISAMIDKLTRRFYDDTNSDRILTLVAPTVVDTAPDAPLPPVATEKPKASDSAPSKPVSEASEGVF